MRKIGKEMLLPIRQLDWLGQAQSSYESWSGRVQKWVKDLFFYKGLLIILVGILLGRALILANISPFFLPFFASAFMMKRDKAGIALVAIVIGSITISFNQGAYAFGSVLLFLIIRKLVSKVNHQELKTLPVLVLATSFISRLLFTYVVNFEITNYDILMASVEAGLSFVLTTIFLQSVPLLTAKKRKQSLKNEEIISLIILLGSVLTGTMGWIIYGLALEHIFSRYLVLLFAFVGGAAIGSTVGVVIGLILSLADVSSLYQMSLLAFAGLLGGLLKDGKKFGVGLGLLIGTLLIGLYGEGKSDLTSTLLESSIAMFMFFLTPHSIVSNLAKYIPGTSEHALEQQQYLRKIRDVTASRVEQFSRVFQALSNSFTIQSLLPEEEDQDREVDYFLSNVTEKTCQMCFKKEQCWEKNFNKTYDYMKQIMHETEVSPNLNRRLQLEWGKHCVKSDKVIDTIQKELNYYQANRKLKQQVQESRRLVADQLLGVSQVMGDFAKEIQRERQNHQVQEEQIYAVLEEIGVEIGHTEIYSLEEGNVDIEMTIPYCNGNGQSEKIIAPLLSDILQETIIVKSEECASFPNGYCHVSFGSAKAYVIETGVANAAKGGAWLSGDSYSTIELGAGKYAVAISDGMGNGERAHLESNETLKLLQNILQSGIEEKVAIKSINSVLSLRTTDEIFSTLDLVMIDLQDASAKFLKIGSTPSFIKRGDQVMKIEAGNLPMGIIQEFDVDVVSEQLKAGDLLIMMSDGIFEGPRHVENYDVWMKRKISEINTHNPQDIADILMEEVIRTRAGQIDDDMTVIVAKIQRNVPKWSTIPIPRKQAN